MDPLIDFFTQSDLFSIFLKFFGIVTGFLYVFFAVVMVRQVTSMMRAVTIKDSGLLIFVSYLQVVLALLVVGYALVIL